MQFVLFVLQIEVVCLVMSTRASTIPMLPGLVCLGVVALVAFFRPNPIVSYFAFLRSILESTCFWERILVIMMDALCVLVSRMVPASLYGRVH